MKNISLNPKPVLVMVIGVVCLFLANLLLSHSIFNTSIALTKVESEAMTVANETNELKVQLSIVTSSELVLKKAAELGFVAGREVLYLENHKTLAKND
jgi:hypothetical protein